MKKFLFYIFLICCSVFSVTKIADCQTINEDYKKQFYKSVSLYKSGDFETSTEILLSILKNRDVLDTVNIIAINNLLGLITQNTGEYEKSIKYLNENINYLDTKVNDYPKKISITYNNLGNLYKNQWKYLKAIDHYEKALITINESNLSLKEKSLEFQYLYYNQGIVYYNMKQYNKAIKYYMKSLLIKKKYNVYNIDKEYFNLARSYYKLNDFKKTDHYFNEAIRIRIKLYGKKYHRLASLYMNYGNFLTKQKNFQKAKYYLLESNEKHEQSFGFNHPYTADSYVYLGNYYSAINKYDSALYWYQKSLIANSKQFISGDIRKNPKIDECLSISQLLRSTKVKAEAIQALAVNTERNKQISLYKLSLKTVDISLNVISKLRNEIISSDSKLIITEQEKECYSLGVKGSLELYSITGDKRFIEKAYAYASSSKASVLSGDMEEEKLINAYVPISVRNEKNETEQKISAYKKLIFEENEKLNPDSSKINQWKLKLFPLKNDYDIFIEDLKKKYGISENLNKSVISSDFLKQSLPKQTTLVEYFISKNTETEEQDLYIFVINSMGFWQFKINLSDSFKQNIKLIKNRMDHFDPSKSNITSFNQYNKASYELYLDLIEPIKHIFNGKDIIIVPDEEIAYISFDALISEYKKYTNINYADLSYLIYDYCFSYAYSTPLLMKEKVVENSDFVYAFAPDYDHNNSGDSKFQFGNLNQTKNEINSILQVFDGETLIGKTAIEDSFKSISDKGAIIHLAMHALTEEENKEFSFLAFSNIKHSDIGEDDILYAYEIEQMKINSPMVVLSACNTGKGELYSGEGVISLSASFIKTGVPAVIHSLWNVNDDAGSKIMQYFYQNLAEGKTKNNALRDAKLKYISESGPSFINPVYWSGYVLTGNISPVKNTNNIIFYLGGGVLFLLIIVLIFIRRRYKMNS